ncbi:hypothetical protein ACFWIB_36740 [Streptomyces sp. NPDC127051]|uniref:hypothetical protein n=1 Tax=Streptomyces sp. NPDC127051 TaxID=3347119 RepID=UPI0036600BC3
MNAAQWVVAEAIAAAAWTDPAYSYATNYISDLGVPDCGTRFQGRDICSGLLSEALVGVSARTAGVFERGGVYSWLVWGVVTGALLLARYVCAPAVMESVPV